MEIADVEVRGERYEAEVPDTLDLAERGAMALHALATEKAAMASLLSFIAEDGLLYTPADTPDRREGDRGYLETAEDFTDPSCSGRMMLAMLYWYQRDHNPAWLPLVRGMAAGLARIGIDRDDYTYYPEGGVIAEFSYLKESGYRDASEPQEEHIGPEGSLFDNVNHVIRGLAQWYETSGDAAALAIQLCDAGVGDYWDDVEGASATSSWSSSSPTPRKSIWAQGDPNP